MHSGEVLATEKKIVQVVCIVLQTMQDISHQHEDCNTMVPSFTMFFCSLLVSFKYILLDTASIQWWQCFHYSPTLGSIRAD